MFTTDLHNAMTTHHAARLSISRKHIATEGGYLAGFLKCCAS